MVLAPFQDSIDAGFPDEAIRLIACIPTKRKRAAMSTEKRSSSDEVVDMELHCVMCGRRLYVSVPQADAVIASLERTGAAILICVCGQAQIIRHKFQRRND